MRKLATVRKIDDIRPIDGADAIELAVIGGWNVVVKKNEFKVDELAVYFEIDSWIPIELAPFLSKSKEPREFEGVKGERLRTIKLRGQISQGLLLPIDSLYSKFLGLNDYRDGQDVTEILGIKKWERPIPSQLAGLVQGNFPTLVPKTDQERIQNLTKEIRSWTEKGVIWELSEKLDGSSCTMYLDNEKEFHVCSRNLDLKRDENNSFWKAAIAYGVEKLMLDNNLDGFAIQGELIGEGIQKNPYDIRGQDFYVFDVFNTKTGEYLLPDERRKLVSQLGLKHVPVLLADKDLGTGDIQEILFWAEDKSRLNVKTEREGIVFKNVNGQESFKAISNKFLLKGGD